MLNGKTCLVTGATSGIGKATACALAAQGATVILISRNAAKGEAVRQEIAAQAHNNDIRVFTADLSIQAEIRRLAGEIRSSCSCIDVLVNNAGGIFDKRVVTPDGIEMTLALNHLGYFLLTNLLLDQLKCSPGARIVNVSSDAHKFGTLDFKDIGYAHDYNSMKSYARSKLLNVLFTYELAERLQGTRITVNAFHPGAVRSRFGKELSGIGGFVFKYLDMFMRSPERGADTAIWLASDPVLNGVSGKYFQDRREKKSSRLSYNHLIAKQLWDVSEQLTQIK